MFYIWFIVGDRYMEIDMEYDYVQKPLYTNYWLLW